MAALFGTPKIPAAPQTPPPAPAADPTTVNKIAEQQAADDRTRVRMGSASNYLSSPDYNNQKQKNRQRFLGDVTV